MLRWAVILAILVLVAGVLGSDLFDMADRFKILRAGLAMRRSASLSEFCSSHSKETPT